MGDGEAAQFLFPKPRDFTWGVFKVRSTPSGEPPTDEDLLSTLTNGIPGSAMPSFLALPEGDRTALVRYVKQLAELTEEPFSVLRPSEPPFPTPELVAMGQEVFERAKCADCHGEEGRGDGPSAPTLEDDWGYPSFPNDFTRGIYKGGSTPSDIYLRFTTGMDGTPMPSFSASTTEEERWALAHYVKALAGRKVAVQPSTGEITATRISGEIPSDPQDFRWEATQAAAIPLMLLWQRDEVIGMVHVRAVHNGQEIAIRLEWEDSEVASNFIRSQDFVDGAAIQFSLSEEQPHFAMGEVGKPVNIWHWRIDRQMDVARFRDVESTYPLMVVDDYPFDTPRYREEIGGTGHIGITPASAQDSVYLTGWGVGNPASSPVRESAVDDLVAEGLGTLTPQAQEHQNVSGEGVWVSGFWKVVFHRTLGSNEGTDVRLEPGSEVPIAFAIWDGTYGDRDGQKAITTWYSLVLGK
jgi:mono/diheme cytochrome c family protein